MHSSSDGADFVIQKLESRLVAVGGSHLFDTTVLRAELHIAWVGILYARWTLGSNRLSIEGDSTSVVAWIQG